MEENSNVTDDRKLAETLKGIWDSLTDEQKEQARACKTPEELMKLAGKAGIELPDEALEAVAGGYIYLNDFKEWEVIRDTDGKVIFRCKPEESEEKSLEKARKIARKLRQSDERIWWGQLDAIRKDWEKNHSGSPST